MKDDEHFTARIFINNGAVLISVPKIVVDSRDLKERIKVLENEWERKHKKEKKCFANIILKLGEDK